MIAGLPTVAGKGTGPATARSLSTTSATRTTDIPIGCVTTGLVADSIKTNTAAK